MNRVIRISEWINERMNKVTDDNQWEFSDWELRGKFFCQLPSYILFFLLTFSFICKFILFLYVSDFMSNLLFNLFVNVFIYLSIYLFIY